MNSNRKLIPFGNERIHISLRVTFVIMYFKHNYDDDTSVKDEII